MKIRTNKDNNVKKIEFNKMENMNFKKIDNKEIVKFLGILGIIIIICSNFLTMHYSSDTFVLYRLGYFNYPSEYFMQDRKINIYIILLFRWCA